ncbi:MAG: hypothetical protein HQK81_12510 [Desulfovibrionaceae bacterium]|nr:hypothetical protein [Desulfovibrionaceae bacterium]MBF0514866.1 hypothetical protein [Desulfovibrionaceae bacterium]
MKTSLRFTISPQPDDTTCGPTCLHAIYAYHGDDVALDAVIAQTPRLSDGGTLEVLLGIHALGRGYEATIYSYNLQVFDPTWFSSKGDALPGLADNLARQSRFKKSAKLRFTAGKYIDFLQRGGKVRFQDLTSKLLRDFLKRSIPVLCGLSATYLYRCAREYGPGQDYDPIRGEPAGHFVVVCGYDHDQRKAIVADPLSGNPMGAGPLYSVDLSRLNCSIMLGIVTFDASLLIIEKPAAPE